MPARQPRRGRLWLNDGSTVPLRPERRKHVWACDFVCIRARDGRAVPLLTVIDEYTRERPAIRAGSSIRASVVTWTLAGLMAARGVPRRIRWEYGYVESFNRKPRDELPDREV